MSDLRLYQDEGAEDESAALPIPLNSVQRRQSMDKYSLYGGIVSTSPEPELYISNDSEQELYMPGETTSDPEFVSYSSWTSVLENRY